MQKHECQNCRKRWRADDMPAIQNLEQRVEPGEPMPSGECPSCGALCHPIAERKRKRLTEQVRTVRLDAKTKALLTRIFIADADGDGLYDESSVCQLIGELRTHLESTGEFDWKRDADPILKAQKAGDE